MRKNIKAVNIHQEDEEKIICNFWVFLQGYLWNNFIVWGNKCSGREKCT